MKKMVLTRLTAIIVLAMLGSLGSARPAAQQHEHSAQAPPQQTEPMQGGRMNMPRMKGMHMDQMAAKQKANTERLNALMTQVKDMTGEKKMAALSEVVGILVEERAMMAEHCAEMRAMMTK